MGRGIFEDGKSLSIVNISDIGFAYDTNMVVYTTLSSDIPELYAMRLPVHMIKGQLDSQIYMEVSTYDHKSSI
ncbi:hypothetical protein ES705_27167 [subsurface metagenome]|nr:hypothetical protein [Methanosarcinales archaeon]